MTSARPLIGFAINYSPSLWKFCGAQSSRGNAGRHLLRRTGNRRGIIGNVCSEILYLLRVWLGYNQPDVAGHVHDYGTKFLVTAGLLNILAMVDALEIAAGRKD